MAITVPEHRFAHWRGIFIEFSRQRRRPCSNGRPSDGTDLCCHALRLFHTSIASRHAYDQGEEHEVTLRSGSDEVALALKEELQVRLAKAGVVVEEARLTHLAYAPEIAPAMLRRQQAEAVVAARRIIVQNAVVMVQMALRELDEKDVVKLDEERKAAMVSNLLVVLCGNSEASPVINAGTLYT